MLQTQGRDLRNVLLHMSQVDDNTDAVLLSIFSNRLPKGAEHGNI